MPQNVESTHNSYVAPTMNYYTHIHKVEHLVGYIITTTNALQQQHITNTIQTTLTHHSCRDFCSAPRVNANADVASYVAGMASAGWAMVSLSLDDQPLGRAMVNGVAAYVLVVDVPAIAGVMAPVVVAAAVVVSPAPSSTSLVFDYYYLRAHCRNHCDRQQHHLHMVDHRLYW